MSFNFDRLPQNIWSALTSFPRTGLRPAALQTLPTWPQFVFCAEIAKAYSSAESRSKTANIVYDVYLLKNLVLDDFRERLTGRQRLVITWWSRGRSRLPPITERSLSSKPQIKISKRRPKPPDESFRGLQSLANLVGRG